MTYHNFSAGPCVLPREVLEEAARSVSRWHPKGLSILEISHRDPFFVEIMDEARQLSLELMGLSADEYGALFLHGGASTQFFSVAGNFLRGKAAYVDTGTWSNKAIKEARKYGEVVVVASSEASGYDRIPDLDSIDFRPYDYLHITTNNTIYGTQWSRWPDGPTPLVADMSSDIYSRRIDARSFDLIYAGAQKNIGPAGVTLVLIRKELLRHKARELPSMMDYGTHLDKESMFNTPPVFAIYVSLLNLRWLRDRGGIDTIEEMNRKKSGIVYAEIDRNSAFSGVASANHRSMMNATFRLNDESLAVEFDALWTEAGIYGLKGHRSVGGYRASMYNALAEESCLVLVEVLRYFEKKFG